VYKSVKKLLFDGVPIDIMLAYQNLNGFFIYDAASFSFFYIKKQHYRKIGFEHENPLVKINKES